MNQLKLPPRIPAVVLPTSPGFLVRSAQDDVYLVTRSHTAVSSLSNGFIALNIITGGTWVGPKETIARAVEEMEIVEVLDDHVIEIRKQ